jgi:hypothetical protein
LITCCRLAAGSGTNLLQVHDCGPTGASCGTFLLITTE